jgi:hypothetical protein
MRRISSNKLHLIILASLLLYGLGISLVKIDYNSVFVDEAYHIVMGDQLLAGDHCPGCAAHTGSVMTWPLFSSYGNRAGGLFGARIMNIILGLSLTLFIYLATRMLFGKELGLIAAAIFIFSGQALYLMKLATYDMTAAFFLGAAFLMFTAAEKVSSATYEGAALATGTILLCLAAITKYLLPAFIPVFSVYILVKYGLRKYLFFSLMPFTVFMTYFFLYSPYPPNPMVIYQIEEVREVARLPLGTLIDWTFRWVALAYLISAFGLFHGKHGRRAALLILFSTPILLIHLVTQTEHSVNKNVVFSLIFLAPAAALGVDHIAHIFSMRETSRAVKSFFAISVLTIIWAYGLYNLKWLEKQHPDVTPLIDFFDENGFDGMIVATNGWDGVMYEYALESKYPSARFDHITWFIRNGESGRELDGEVDFVLCEDEYYGKHYPSPLFEDILQSDCNLLEEFTINHSWGETHAMVFGRRL